MLDVAEVPTSSPTVAVTQKKGHCQVPVQAPGANGQVFLGEYPSTNNREQGKVCQNLQLHPRISC